MSEEMKDALCRMEKQKNSNVSWKTVQLILPDRSAKELYISPHQLQVHVGCHNCSYGPFHEKTQLRTGTILWATCPVPEKFIYTSQKDEKICMSFWAVYWYFWLYDRKEKGRKKEREKKGKGEGRERKRERGNHVTFKKHCEKTSEKKTSEKKTSILYEQ